MQLQWPAAISKLPSPLRQRGGVVRWRSSLALSICCFFHHLVVCPPKQSDASRLHFFWLLLLLQCGSPDVKTRHIAHYNILDKLKTTAAPLQHIHMSPSGPLSCSTTYNSPSCHGNPSAEPILAYRRKATPLHGHPTFPQSTQSTR